MSSNIQWFNQTDASLPVNSGILSEIADLIQENEDCHFDLVEVVMVSPTKIVELNKEYLGRDYVTDIITFRYDEEKHLNNIEGTLFCCWERIQEQAGDYGESSSRELYRIIIHGLLHLIGYEDQSPGDKQQMREKEEYYIDNFESRP